MIDYDELDERIRRIVREELVQSMGMVESLSDADKRFPYKDTEGDTWKYDEYSNGWYMHEGHYYEAESVDRYGPFSPDRSRV